MMRFLKIIWKHVEFLPRLRISCATLQVFRTFLEFRRMTVTQRCIWWAGQLDFLFKCVFALDCFLFSVVFDQEKAPCETMYVYTAVDFNVDSARLKGKGKWLTGCNVQAHVQKSLNSLIIGIGVTGIRQNFLEVLQVLAVAEAAWPISRLEVLEIPTSTRKAFQEIIWWTR